MSSKSLDLHDDGGEGGSSTGSTISHSIQEISTKRRRRQKKGKIFKKNLNSGHFLKSWMDNPEFAGWLQPHYKSKTKATCIICASSFKAKLHNIKRHILTDCHRENIILAQDFLLNAKPGNHENNVKTAEIKIAELIASHNVAVEFVDAMVPVLKDIFKDSEIAQDIKLSSSKCTQIITNVLAQRQAEKTFENLKNVKFSVLVDESTDNSVKKHMCVLTRYCLPSENDKVVTQLLDLIEIDGIDSTAEKLYDCFKSKLEERGIPLQNIVSLACDNASVMVGCNYSFYTHLKADVPNLILMNCVCHSVALIANSSSANIPDDCEFLIRSIAIYINSSPKRMVQLKEFQLFCNENCLRILKLSKTRWLSFHSCIDRVLKYWNALRLFFTSEVFNADDKVKSASINTNAINQNQEELAETEQNPDVEKSKKMQKPMKVRILGG